MTHLWGKLKTLVIEIFLLTNKLEAEDIVGVDHVVLQGALLEGQLSHGLVKHSASAAWSLDSRHRGAEHNFKHMAYLQRRAGRGIFSTFILSLILGMFTRQIQWSL